ncbi:MAG TPA: TIM barrel protein [Candidatus Woesearchaeota archaeon]|nr:TIM barrel protein [Candidatus Woesearchaeota archaeon]
MNYNKLLFGTAGTPLGTPKPKSSLNALDYIKEIELDGMELEFVRGVRMSEELAMQVKEKKERLGLELSAHGPYYINLNSLSKDIVNSSVERIYQTAKIAHLAGAKSITFHAAYYLSDTKDTVFERVKNILIELIKRLKAEGINIFVRPELTGKPTQFGDIDELIRLSRVVDGILPCIDFSHNYARTNGKFNSYEEFYSFMEKYKRGLGDFGLYNMHCHISGIDFGDKGEKKHLNLVESGFNVSTLLSVIKEFGCKGIIICESPNIESDALYMKKLYFGT